MSELSPSAMFMSGSKMMTLDGFEIQNEFICHQMDSVVFAAPPTDGDV